MTLLTINAASGQVKVRVSTGNLEAMVADCVRESYVPACAIISDSNVDPLCGSRVEKAALSACAKAARIVHPAGERRKSLKTVDFIYRRMFEAGTDRSWLAIALGGGVTGDLAGFAASTYMRGLPYVQIPTSLLAQADSAVGGKVGVNHPRAGKNMIGLFSQPLQVLIDPSVSVSMPERDFASGFAEIVKYGIILDPAFFAMLEARAEALAARNVPDLEAAILESVRMKASIVEKDEKESGIRAILNLGHTVGHAIEAAAKGSVLHGEAVSIGIAAASALAGSVTGFGREDARRIANLLGKFSLPVSWPKGVSPSKAVRSMRLDKKFRNGKARIVLPEAIGKVRIVEDFPLDGLAKFMLEFARS